jgi:hypothetical protein
MPERRPGLPRATRTVPPGPTSFLTWDLPSWMTVMDTAPSSKPWRESAPILYAITGGLAVFGLRVRARVPCLHGTILAYRFPNSEGNVMTLTGWGVLLGLLVVAAIVVAAIALIIRFVIRHRRGYD